MRARPTWLHHLATWFVALLQAKAFIPLCLLLAIVIRLIWIVVIPNQQVADAAWYYNRAVAIASGQGYSIDGMPTAFWPVGYPSFLASVFVITAPSVFVGEVANVVLALGIIFVSYLLAKRLFESEWVGRFTILILTFYPTFIVLTSLLLSELLFVFLILIAILLMQYKNVYEARDEYSIRERISCYITTMISGILFGFACLTRPQAIIIPTVIFVFQTIQAVSSHSTGQLKAIAKRYSIVSIVMLASLAPWTIRNYNLYNHIVLVSTNNGFNIFTGNSLYATGTNLDQVVIDQNIAPLVQGSHTEYEADERLRSAAFAYIQTHPFATLWLWPKKLWYLYGTDIGIVKLNETGIKPFQGTIRIMLYGVKAIAQAYYLILFAGFVMGAIMTSVVAWRTRRPFPLVGIGIIVTFTAVHIVYFANDRFHFPMTPWMAIYMSALLEQWLRRFT